MLKRELKRSVSYVIALLKVLLKSDRTVVSLTYKKPAQKFLPKALRSLIAHVEFLTDAVLILFRDSKFGVEHTTGANQITR